MSTALGILHVDMDAFYAAIEQRERPGLRGRPVVVGGRTEDRGVVSTASYEARAFGVRSAMPMKTAHRLCPHATFLPVRMGLYAQVGRQVRAILATYTGLVEPLSLDEAFLDVRGTVATFGPAPDIARQIRARIRDELGLTASVGVAVNKFLAKLAGDLRKPDALVVIAPDEMRAVLDPLPVRRLWGVGPRAEARLHAMNVKTIGQLSALSESALAEQFGDGGRHLWRLSHGIDDRAVVPNDEAKSISTETTFARDLGNRAVLRAWLLGLVEELGTRLRDTGVRARTVELKFRAADFRTATRAVTLADPTDLTAELWQAARSLFERRVTDGWLPLRLLGVGATGLVKTDVAQGDLFAQPWRDKQRSLDRAMDAIRQRYGDESIRRAGGRPE